MSAHMARAPSPIDEPLTRARNSDSPDDSVTTLWVELLVLSVCVPRIMAVPVVLRRVRRQPA